MSVIHILLLCGCVESNPDPLQNSIKIVQNNVCSLKLKLDIISVEFASYDIISISETRLDDTVLNNLELVTSVFTREHKILHTRKRIGNSETR